MLRDSEDESGTTVLEKDLYEFPHWNDTATCTECGAEMDVPPMDDHNADMKEPFWSREDHWGKFEDVYHAHCEECYAAAISELLGGGSSA